jgi:hypothetical protein
MDDEKKVYVTCNAVLDVETNEHCEWDGDITPRGDWWRCPSCMRLRMLPLSVDL